MIPDRKGLSVKPLTIRPVFEQLSANQKLYAHYLSRAAWSGTRIIQRQVSPESCDIFDLILELYRACAGDWSSLLQYCKSEGKEDNLEAFVLYSAVFLANIGNYYGYGDRKFVPDVPASFLGELCSVNERTAKLLTKCLPSVISPNPGSLGIPGDNCQSAYYPGPESVTTDELREISALLEKASIGQENTRVRKFAEEQLHSQANIVFDVLLASTDIDDEPMELGKISSGGIVRCDRGDHVSELKLVCDHLEKAKEVADSQHQRDFIDCYIRHFRSGDIKDFKAAQESWVRDRGAAVETVLGFVEQYRDPFGARSEFEGMVLLIDRESSKALETLVSESHKFIQEMPWVTQTSDECKMGPFENNSIDVPEFTSVHALTYCSSVIFLGINLPNFEDIRDRVGFKNFMLANRNSPKDLSNVDPSLDAELIDPAEAIMYLKHEQISWDLHTSLHELIGHGTGNKLLRYDPASQTGNFDPKHPPIHPLTGDPVNTYYDKDQTFSDVFEDLTQTLNECRADCIGLFLLTNKEVLAVLGYNDSSELRADNIIYAGYLHIGVLGLEALMSYDPDSMVWGQAHERGYFAMMQILLSANGLMSIDVQPDTNKITVHVDRSRITTDGKGAIEELMLRLHMYRCTADVQGATSYYNDLTRVGEDMLRIRNILDARPPKTWVFLQANTFLDNGEVRLEEYDVSPEGVIESWAKRVESPYDE